MMGKAWVTGARGFLGRSLVHYLADCGELVAGVGHGHLPAHDLDATGLAAWVNSDIHSGSLDLLLQTVGRPDIIFHLAGGSAVGPSLANPLEDFERTVFTTARLFDWVRFRCSECPVVAVSSAAVYGSGHRQPITEECIGTPYSPYGFHKSMMELVCRSYGQSFGLRTAVVRVFSAYGVGLNKQLLWDTCNRLLGQTRPLVFDGTGTELRDWIEARDVARLLALVGRVMPSTNAPVVNGGTGIGSSVRKIVEMVMDAWGDHCDISFSGRSRPGDPGFLVADSTRLGQLGFAPEILLEDGLRVYVDWFRRQRGGR